MIDMTAEFGILSTALATMAVVQMIVQAQWLTENALLTLPHITPALISDLSVHGMFFDFFYI